MNRYFATGAIAAAALFSAGQAGATVYGAQYTGIVTSGYDLTGLFGTANASLNGKAYTETFLIDTSAGGFFSSTAPNASYQKDLGGTVNGFLASVSASITINGITQSLNGNSLSSARIGYNPSTSVYDIFDKAEDSSSSATTFTDNYITGGVTSSVPGAIPTVFGSYKIAVDGVNYQNLGSAFQFYTVDTGTSTALIKTQGILSPTSATPEPLTWVLMMFGIGGIGIALRSHKRFAHQATSVAA